LLHIYEVLDLGPLQVTKAALAKERQQMFLSQIPVHLLCRYLAFRDNFGIEISDPKVREGHRRLRTTSAAVEFAEPLRSFVPGFSLAAKLPENYRSLDPLDFAIGSSNIFAVSQNPILTSLNNPAILETATSHTSLLLLVGLCAVPRVVE
jgi:hypothetical protein